MNSRKRKPPEPRKQIRELFTLLRNEPERLLAAFADLSSEEQLSLLLFAPGQLRQELLLAAPAPKRLAAQLPDQEIYLSIKEIGFRDAIPLLKLMSPKQLRFLTDLEAWDKDEFRLSRFMELLELLYHCGEDTLSGWLQMLDPELLATALKECGRVTKYDPFKDQSEEQEEAGSITCDGYYRYHPHSQELRELLDPALRLLNENDPDRYSRIMESVAQDMPAEVGGHALQCREGRLADFGIPDFESACSIYRPLSLEEFRRDNTVTPPAPKRVTAPTPVYAVRWLPAESFLHRVLRTLSDHPRIDFIRVQLAALGNKVVIADGLELKEPDIIRYALQKVAGYLSIGLEFLSGGDIGRARPLLLASWPQSLFQVGYSRVHELAAKADRLRDRVGFRWIDRHHFLADSPLEETLRGVSRRRPMFFEGVSQGNWLGFREFLSLADVRAACCRIVAAGEISRFFEGLDCPPGEIKKACLESGLGDRLDTVKWSQVLNTMWARWAVGELPRFRLLSPAELDLFRRTVFLPANSSQTGRVDPEQRRIFVDWMRGNFPGLEAPVQRTVDDWIRAAINSAEEDLGGIAREERPDPRFVQCLCVRQLP